MDDRSLGHGPPEQRHLSRLSLIALALAATLPILAVLGLFAADITLGSARGIVYPFSSIARLRLVSAMTAMILAAPIGWSVFAVASPRRRRRREGLAVFWSCYAMVVAWAYLGSPLAVHEQRFNSLSPSQDGAFMIEARRVTSLGDYLKRYGELTHRDTETLQGIRVLSNPPGATVLAWCVHQFNLQAPALFVWIQRAAVGDEEPIDDPDRELAEAVCFMGLLTLMWAGAIVFGYLLARLWLPPPPALVVAMACTFNPAALCFVPGKDPAQLLTALAMLYFWFSGVVNGSRVAAVVAGIVAVAGAMLSLVQVWIGVIMIAASAWHFMLSPGKRRHFLLACSAWSGASALGVCLLAYLFFDHNIPVTLVAVANSYLSLQCRVIIRPWYMNLIGGTLFLLFIGPAFWMFTVTVVATRGQNEASRLGRTILAITVAVMLGTYFTAQNAEVMRLWVVFIPMLIWPTAMMVPLLLHDTKRSIRLLAAIMVCQYAGTLLQWSVMDARGTEGRIVSGRLFDG